MRTLHEYEPSDIKMSAAELGEGQSMDPVHGFLMGQMFIVLLTGMKPLPTDPPDEPAWPIRRLIADFLNSAQKAGITIAVGEAIPAAFRDSA